MEAWTSVLVDDAEAVIVQEPRAGTEQSRDRVDDDRRVRTLMAQRREAGDLGDVMGERFAVDHRVGVVEDDRAVTVVEMTGEELGLPVLHVGLQRVERVRAVHTTDAGEPVLIDERHDVIELISCEQPRIGVEHERVGGHDGFDSSFQMAA